VWQRTTRSITGSSATTSFWRAAAVMNASQREYGPLKRDTPRGGKQVWYSVVSFRKEPHTFSHAFEPLDSCVVSGHERDPLQVLLAERGPQLVEDDLAHW